MTRKLINRKAGKEGFNVVDGGGKGSGDRREG